MRFSFLIVVFLLGCVKNSKNKNCLFSNLKEYHLPQTTILHLKKTFGNKFHPKFCVIISNSDENKYSFTFYEHKPTSNFFYNKFMLLQYDTIKMVHFEDLIFSSKNVNSFQFNNLSNSMTFTLNLNGKVLESQVISN